MIQEKNTIKMNGYRFESMAIKIGYGSGAIFDRIAKELGGTC